MINSTEVSKAAEAKVVESKEPVPDFTGSLAEIAIPEIKVRATLKDQTTKVELPRKYFRAKNLQILKSLFYAKFHPDLSSGLDFYREHTYTYTHQHCRGYSMLPGMIQMRF